MPELPALTGLYGKVPAHGDFVRRGLPSSFCGPWDAWLQAGMETARARLGAAWEAAWREAPPWRFWLPAGVCGPSAVAGVMLWSEDMVGRRFPITLAALDAAAPPPPAWFERAEAAARAGRDGRLDADRLAAVLAGEAPQPDPAPFAPPGAAEPPPQGEGDFLGLFAAAPEPDAGGVEEGDVLGALAASGCDPEPEAEGDVLGALIAAADRPADTAEDPAPTEPGAPPHAAAPSPAGPVPIAEEAPPGPASPDATPVARTADEDAPCGPIAPHGAAASGQEAGPAAHDTAAPIPDVAAPSATARDARAGGEDAAPPLPGIAAGPATEAGATPCPPAAAPPSAQQTGEAAPEPDPAALALFAITGEAASSAAAPATSAASPVAPDPPAGGGWWTLGGGRIPPMVWPLAGLPPPDLFICLLEPAA